MNYIHQLQKEIKEAKDEVRAHEMMLLDLKLYLLSDKFDDDPTVQVRDVLNRIDQGLQHHREEIAQEGNNAA